MTAQATSSTAATGRSGSGSNEHQSAQEPSDHEMADGGDPYSNPLYSDNNAPNGESAASNDKLPNIGNTSSNGKQNQKRSGTGEAAPGSGTRPTDAEYMDHLEALYSNGSGKSTCVSCLAYYSDVSLTQIIGSYTCTTEGGPYNAGKPERQAKPATGYQPRGELSKTSSAS